MSAVKDKFYELLVPRMEAHGFTFKKTANNFIKMHGNMQWNIHLRWDGRGGTSIINFIEFYVFEPKIEKAFKNLIGINGINSHQFCSISFYDAGSQRLVIPVMYTQAVSDLASNMNFKALAKIPFEEKYPLARIQNCVNVVEKLFINNVFPFFEAFDTELKVYEALCQLLYQAEKLEDVFHFYILQIKLYAHKLKLPEPDILKDYTFYIEQFKRDWGNNPNANFENLEKRLREYQF